MNAKNSRGVAVLGLPGPGREVRVPLHLWAEYQQFYGLVVRDVEFVEGRLWVGVEIQAGEKNETKGQKTQ